MDDSLCKNTNVMKKVYTFMIVLLTLTYCLNTHAQNEKPKMGFQSSNENIYGTWSSWDGSSILYMNYGDVDTFVRVSHTEDGKETATGQFTIEEEYLYVQKENEEYRLMFFLKGMQMVVMKPDSAGGAGEAWLFTKVSDYALN